MFDNYMNEQQQGNTAFDKGSYEVASFYYINAKNNLDTMSIKVADVSISFINCYVDITRKIIETIFCRLKKVTIDNLSDTDDLWKLIPNLITDMEKILPLLNNSYVSTKNKNSILNKISNVFSRLVIISESISDRAFTEAKPSIEKELYKQGALDQAQRWIERALEYRQKTNNKNIPINVHLGYLNILYQQYQINHRDDFLSIMARQINKYDLLSIEPKSNNRLELLGYAIISNCTDETCKKQLIREGVLFIAQSNLKNSYLVSDFKNIVATTTFRVKDFMKMATDKKRKHNDYQLPLVEKIITDNNKPFKKRKTLRLLFSVNVPENPDISGDKSKKTMISSINSC